MMKFGASRFRRGAAATAAAACTVLVFGAASASAATTDLTDVTINEVESNNDAVNGDWIELFNTGASNFDDVDLSGAILSDDNNRDRFVIPAGTILPQGGWKAFRVDDPLVSGSFGLGGADSARLFAPDTADLATATPVDSYSWTDHALTTYGANPDGSDNFETTTSSTFGAANDFGRATIGNIDGVMLNEVESDGDRTHGDWVELYNTNGSAVNIDGAIITDSEPNHQFIVPASTPDIPALGYAAFQVDDSSVAGSFGLGSGDSAKLYAPNDVNLTRVIDQFSWTSHAVITWGRTTPGTGDWAQTTASTFGAANQFGSNTTAPDLRGVVINEAESAGDDVHGDWIELKNTTSSPVTLDGAILSDNDDGHFFRIPTSTPDLAAGDVAAFRVDDPALGSAEFGLGDVDSARLFRADAVDLSRATPVDSEPWTTHAQRTYGLNDSGVWGPTNKGTFAAPNDFTSTVTADVSDVVLNEVVSTGDLVNGDWVELLNTCDSAIDIGGAIISDSDDAHAYRIPDNTMIPAGGTYVVRTETTAGFGLGSDDAIRFYRAGATVGTSIPLDHFEWSQHAVGSYARQADGMGDWIQDATPSYDAPN
ncbi:MAG TPA: lamin tail domain-containing protein [Conexibacter sp.]|jgi:hypothetical protein